MSAINIDCELDFNDSELTISNKNTKKYLVLTLYCGKNKNLLNEHKSKLKKIFNKN